MSTASGVVPSDVRLAQTQLPDGSRLSVDACGDTSIIGVFSDTDAVGVWANAQGLAAEVRSTMGQVARTVVATYDSVFIEFDADTWWPEQVAEQIVGLSQLAPFPVPLPRRRVIVPVVYGGDHGPDLVGLAGELGMTPEELVAEHCRTPYVVRSVASPPGAPMLDAPATLRGIPRLAVPRPRVPAGSLAIAGVQCTVYATSSPGGWRLIGRTPSSLIDLRRTNPLVMSAGDLLEFVPLPLDEWHHQWGRPPEVRRA